MESVFEIFRTMIMKKFLKNTAAALLIGLLMVMSAVEGIAATEISKEQVKGLDEQVQDIKNDVLSIATEIARLEEKLIYPANTQISVFLTLAQGDKFRLDSVKLKLDGKEATSYIYTSKELEALQHGGVQRIYTGNIRTGEHTLEVSLIGKSISNSHYQYNASYNFSKEASAKLIEITLAGPGFGNQGISFKN